ncbi:MAG: 30S ribosomal protein S14 [Candidatus Micrarchaeota archaeon]|nr:30S ribosomal protein S14 [Candidatus Micrarchaeota archaeon]
MAKKKKEIPFELKLQGKGLRKCRFCGSARGLIRSYGLRICRRCFREVGEEIGFRKYQ